MKRLCYYHSKDPDGWVSGAIVKRKYPDIELRGIAKEKGGGGHRNAAGFETTELSSVFK